MTTNEIYKKLITESIENKKPLTEEMKLCLQEKAQIENNDIETLKLLNETRLLINEYIDSHRKNGFADYWKKSMEKEKELLDQKDRLRRKGKESELQKVQRELQKERQARNYLKSKYLYDAKKKYS